MTGRITLRDVARRAGYSTATVSLALRDHPRLPEDTRALIQRLAREMGYRPDPLLASIAAARWRGRSIPAGSTLAFIADGPTEGRDGMSERAGRLGYRLEMFDANAYPDSRRLSDLLYHRSIMGIMVGQIFTPGFCERFDWSHFAAVAASEGRFRPPVHLVMPNHFRAVQIAWDHASQMGSRRIGLMIFDMPETLDFHDRRAAYLDRQLCVPVSRRIPVFAVDPEAAGTERPRVLQIIDAWIRRYRPDMILGFNSAFPWLLKDAGWRMPEQVGFINLWKTNPEPAWPGLRLSPDEVGRRAVDWVDSLLRAGERGPPDHPGTMEIEMTWEEAQP